MHGRSGELTKDAESQLQLTQFAMDNASVEIYWIGSDARIHYANNHACKTLGYTKEELVQLSLTDLDPFFPIGRWNQHWQQLKQDKSQTFETWHKRKNGVIFPVEVVANFVSLGDHEFNVGFATDISKRKHAEQVLLESEKRLSILLDSNKIHMWAFDGANYTYTNKQWFDYTGQNPGDFLTIERWVSAVHPDDLEKSTAIWLANWESKTEHDNYFRLRRYDGVYRDFYCHAVPIFDEQGVFQYFQGFNLDITERNAAEHELRKFKAIIESSDVAIITKTLIGIIESWNRGAEQLFGYTADEVIGRTMEMLIPPDRSSEEAEILARISRGERVDHFETVRRHKDGRLINISASISPIMDDQGKIVGASKICTDITMSKAAADEIKYLAFYDPLTGLANRRLMSDRMDQILSLARRTGELVAICMIDLDGFKQVNDQKGHEAGDQLLIEVAKRLQECIRESDTASRFGGDEFAIILGGFKENSECIQSINRIIWSLAAPYMVVNEIARVTASIGATIFPNDSGNPDQLLRHADEAMYEAKHAGKNCYRLFNPSLMNQQEANNATFKKIENALAKGQFVLYYQPQVDCRLGKVTGVEALIRWKHPILGLLEPSEFIPLIEHHDLIITIGEWVVQNALKQLVKWQSLGIDLTISINISARQLHQIDFIDHLNVLLAGHDQNVIRRLEIEVTETSVLEDVNAIANAIHKCREMGVRIAIDDFGTGFSSLAHLKKIPFDILKIDKSFVLGMLRNPEDLVLVDSVIGLATSFNRKVIAEGVESIDHVLMLLELRCSLMQGYEIARPMPAEQIPSWIGKFAPNPLWKLVNSQRPSRNYFEMLLAEVNHRHWIEHLVNELCESQESFNPDLLIDHRQCRFGRWYYGDGHRQFGTEDWFLSMEPVHQRIHQTAARLCEHKRAGKLAEVKAEEAILLFQQDELDLLLRRLRSELADKYLMDQITKPHGEPT